MRALHLLTRLYALLLMVGLFLPGAAEAQQFPALSGRVVDAANLLSPAQEISLEAKLTRLEQQSQRQLVVVTIADLGGYDIADYGFRLGDHWGIGDKGRDDGALLIIAPQERKVRIEVGYGLEGVLTDALSGRIIRNSIVPHFKQGDYPGGIMAGTDELVRILMLPPEEAKKLAAQAAQEQQGGEDKGQVLVAIFLIFMFIILPMLLRGRAGRAYRNGALPVILWGPGIGGGGSSGGGWSSGGGGFSGGGGGFGGGGASGGW
ncbi:MAG: TPM domain-containing protein [Sphingobium sp.]|nr:TPM domain-containing protein [Sphingobium sp.]MBP6111841.1 TPM domain-containing protein [Sphingobium sp.]MBP8669783.1 TPM domain-containing protein [Sphingobium sp.]MBP9156457.1 TPM domain-containing protein [Sphingobium sp.]